jgi:hypothetical protein
MDYAVILQELAVALHEISGSKPFGRLLHLRVRESEPDFAHLICSKKAVDDFDIRTQESNVLHARLQRLGGSRPHAGTLYIHSDEVLFGKHASQSDSIFSPTTAQFQDNGMVVLEKPPVPVPFHVKRHIIHRGIRILENMRITRHIGKLL